MTEEPILVAEADEQREESVPPKPPRSFKRISISPDMLYALMQGKARIVDLGVPADAKLVACGNDFIRSLTFDLIVEHPSFPSVPEGEYVPCAEPILWLQS